MTSGVNFNVLSEDRIKTVLKTKWLAHDLFAFWSISTTNDFAYRRAQLGAKEGTLVIAEKQQQGRGRLSRQWDSPFNRGLWFSIILRPGLPASKAGLIPYLGSVSVAEAMEKLYQLKPNLKWPNDVLINGKKMCGILSEAEFKNGKIDFIILGIGINANQKEKDWTPELKDIATSLRIELEKRVDRAEFLAEVLLQLEKNYEDSQLTGFKNIVNNWKVRCPKYHKSIVVQQENEQLEGRFADIDENGFLILETESGDRKKIVAGDLIK